MQEMIELRNDYHNTRVLLRTERLGFGTYKLTPHQQQRAWRELCGNKNCRCWDGLRGVQMKGLSVLKYHADGSAVCYLGFLAPTAAE